MSARAYLNELPHWVYRYYDANDQVLYIGCTSNLDRRDAQHRRKDWYSQVASREVERFENRFAGTIAEAALIQSEQPPHNVHLKGEPHPSDPLRFEIDMAIARNPANMVQIMRSYEPLIKERMRIAQIEAEAERKMAKRTLRRLAESKWRAQWKHSRAAA